MADEYTGTATFLTLEEAESMCKVDSKHEITAARDCIFAVLECLSQPRVNWEAASKYAASAKDHVSTLDLLCSYQASARRNEGTVRDETRGTD